ncbi:MAG TPA: TIGR03560 family F420-dependent LLM class oxidoreductase [Anaerolineales bacterium]|nr:TIGR03560 family F420-dependent LLM class oxidoreductase [Anaerolineales bacterium]
MDIAIMIEGQNGLNWDHWKNISAAVEDLGFWGLFRSDHFTNRNPPDKDSLELWASLTWLADNTKRIHFGSMVSPVSFRHPAITARTASAVDDLSNGRLILGLGAGWQEREHKNYGFDLLGVNERFKRFEEGVELVKMLFDSNEHFDFAGKYFQAKDVLLLPRPNRVGGPPILIGGNGTRRTLPLAAKLADEWNSLLINKQTFQELNTLMDVLLENEGRKKTSIKRSMMTGVRFGKTREEVERKIIGSDQSIEYLRGRGFLIGTGDEIKEQIMELENAGLQRIMLQWLDLEDIEGLTLLAESILKN